MKVWAYLLLIAIAGTFAGLGQVTTATLILVVQDQAGAVVPNAAVSVVNTGTGIRKEFASDSNGLVTASAIEPGTYRVTVEKPGFKSSVVPDVELTVNQRVRVEITLSVGQVNETVTVEGGVPLVNTENAEISSVVDERRIQEFPLNGRNFMELATLSTGITEGVGGNAKGAYYSGNKAYGPSTAGAPAQENNYQLDGVTNKEAFFNTYNVSPSVDAVQEFRIQIGQYSAEFGGGGGAVINVVTKSGTNQFHGTVFEFLRNDVLDARNFFAASKAPLRRNQFGGSVGGPVLRDKTFFFANFDGTRERRGLTRTAFVPTDALKAGDLSGLGKQLTDPLSGSPFPGARIPQSRIDPISQKILAFYPSPNIASSLRNYTANPSASHDINSGLIRIDHQWNAKNQIMGRYAIENIDDLTPGTYPLVGGQLAPYRYQNLAIAWTSSIIPALLNEARFGYNRDHIDNKGQNTGKPIGQDLGLFFAGQDANSKGFPESISIGSSLVSSIGESQPFLSRSSVHQFVDSVTYTRGRHTFKGGIDLKWIDSLAVQSTHSNGSYTFNGQYTGDGFADFLLGYPARILVAAVPNTPGDYSRHTAAGYFLDEWKVSPKLSVNLGIRYEFESFPVEANGANSFFDTSLQKGNVRGGLAYPSQNKRAQDFYTNHSEFHGE